MLLPPAAAAQIAALGGEEFGEGDIADAMGGSFSNRGGFDDDFDDEFA
jgi:hypothetical protein